jgi:hypothetical protein
MQALMEPYKYPPYHVDQSLPGENQGICTDGESLVTEGLGKYRAARASVPYNLLKLATSGGGDHVQMIQSTTCCFPDSQERGLTQSIFVAGNGHGDNSSSGASYPWIECHVTASIGVLGVPKNQIDFSLRP